MTETTTARRTDIDELLTALRGERDVRVLEAARKLSGIVTLFDQQTGVLEDIKRLRAQGKDLTQEQYEAAARAFCSRYNPVKEIDRGKPVCENCSGKYDGHDLTPCDFEHSKRGELLGGRNPPYSEWLESMRQLVL